MDKLLNNIAECVLKKMGVGYSVEPHMVKKSNGIERPAVIIKRDGQICSPCIYIDLDKVADGLIRDYYDVMSSESRDLRATQDLFKGGRLDRDYILSHVTHRLVNAKLNAAMADKWPHRDFLNMTVQYQVLFPTGTALVTGKMQKTYDLTQQELEEAASRNTPGLMRFKWASILDVTGRMEDAARATECNALEPEAEHAPMYVFSGEENHYGACVMLYPHTFADLASRLGDDLFILPSSVHEVIAVPYSLMDVGYLRGVVADINKAVVNAEEVLAYSVYLFDRETEKISICKD